MTVKEVVAFANTCDGIIYIGINNQGEVVGLQDCDDVIERASASIRDAIKPDLSMHISLKVTKVENKDIVVIEVLRGTYPPLYSRERVKIFRSIYKTGQLISSSLRRLYIKQMIKETDGDSFEKLRSINQDLTFDYADKFFKNEEIDFGNAQKKTLGMISVDGLYTNLALLLSDQCIHTIKIAVFEGTEDINSKIEKSLPDLF